MTLTTNDICQLLFGCDAQALVTTAYIRHGPIPRHLAHSIAALEGSPFVVYWDDGTLAWIGTPSARSADLARDLWPRVYKAVGESIAGALMNREQLRRLADKLVRERDEVKLKQYGVEI